MSSDLFPVLDPPRGGLQRLQARMERPRRASTAWLAVPALAVALLLAVVIAWPQPAAAPLHGEHPALALPGPAVSGRQGTAVAPVPAGDGVILYFVSPP